MEGTVAWAEQNFRNVRLFDRRRTSRLVNIASKLAENKGSSLARLFHGWYDTKATYNLLNHPFMTPDVIQSEHRKQTCESISHWSGDVLICEDDSEFEWNKHEPIEGLGPIGSGRAYDQGFVLHSSLAIGISENRSLKLLGLPFQQYYIRPPKRQKRKKRSETAEFIETDLWREMVKQKTIPALDKIIRICDRAADIYEVMVETTDYGCNHIIRLKHDRCVIEPTEKPIKSLMKDLPSMGCTSIEKRGREGSKKRTISLQVNWAEVKIRAPARPGKGIGTLSPIEVVVVHIWGTDPETDEVIEWFLYTSLPVNNLEDAIRVCQYYAKRWVIEDYHKALKSGLKAERLQLESAQGLFAAIAIMSVVALRLIDVRESLRSNPEAPAEESGLDKLELLVLGKYLKRELKTVRCVALAIGKLGGHLNRRSDGMPGIMTLWLGMSQLISLVEGARLAINLNF